MSRFLLAAIAFAVFVSGCATQQEPALSSLAEARALSDRGLAQLDSGDPEGAIVSLDRVIAYGSPQYQDYTRRAAAYGQLKKYATALKDTDRALELDPNQWRTHLQRAVLNQKLGRLDAAIQDLDNAIILKPDEVELARRRGYLTLVAGRFAEAAAAYDRLALMEPRSTTAPTGRGVAFYLAGDWRTAANEFERVLRIAPDDGVAALWFVKSNLRVPRPIEGEQVMSNARADPEWEMVDALLGEFSAEEVTAKIAALGDPAEKRHIIGACERAIFLGEWRLIRVNGEGARREFEAAQKFCPADSIEGTEATTEIGRLKQRGR
jgi:Tfp pilus assembly protein PilF